MIRLAFLALASTNDVPAAPVTKIADTLGNLLQSSNEEGQLDQQSYQAFYNWCQQTYDVRKQALSRYQAIQQELESKFAVHQALNKQLRDETAQLQEESLEAKQAIEQASILRQHEHENYLKEQKNLAGMLQMLNRAVDVLSTSSSRQTLLSVAQSVQQLAAKSSLVSDSQRDQLSLFVQETMNGNDEDTITESASVSQVLKELIGKFQATMSNAGVEEQQADEQFSQLIALKKQSFMTYITAKDAKDATLAESLQRTAQDQRALQESKVVVKGGEEYLKNVKLLCTHKSTQWASRSQVRQDIIAITQGVITDLSDASSQLSAARYASSRPRAFSSPYGGPYTSLMATDSHTERVRTDINSSHNTAHASASASAMVGAQSSGGGSESGMISSSSDDQALNLPLVGDGQAFPSAMPSYKNLALIQQSDKISTTSNKLLVNTGTSPRPNNNNNNNNRNEGNNVLPVPNALPSGNNRQYSFIQMSADLNMQSPDAMFVPTNTNTSNGGSSKVTAMSVAHQNKVDKKAFAQVQPSSSSASLLQTSDTKGMKYPMGEVPMMPAEPNMMTVQQNFNLPPAKSNTYSAVRKMVQNMSAQIQADTEDEDKHKQWCDQEIAKNAVVENDKETKVQRLNTKIDSERQIAQELDQDLELLAKEVKAVDEDEGGLRVLKLQERTGYGKYAQNHQMAQQIIRQAISILQRFRSLAEAQSHTQPQGFLQPTDVSALSLSSIDALSQLLTRYEELRGNSDKAENQSVIDFQAFTRQNKSLLQVLMQTKNYKQSLRLQAMADLDNDTEDDNALKAQAQSVQAYVTRLRQACADVLQHYNERKERRSRNLEALNRAGQVINLDNADEVHQTLTNLAQKTDKEAAQLLKSSENPSNTNMPIEKHNPTDLSSSMSSLANFATSFSQPTLVQETRKEAPPSMDKAAPLASMESTNANILRDLSSLQDLSSADAHADTTAGLSMLPAMR